MRSAMTELDALLQDVGCCKDDVHEMIGLPGTEVDWQGVYNMLFKIYMLMRLSLIHI